MEAEERISVLFVCLGNICRSPLAEAVFWNKVSERELAAHFRVDSAGTGAWHIGESPDPRTQAIAKKNKVNLTSRARQVYERDFEQYDHIICMDQANADDLVQQGGPKEKIGLLLDYDDATPLKDVPDPYNGPADGFQVVYGLIDSACEAMLDQMIAARS